MSTATQTPFSELNRATPAFSYAQAAKGRSPSGPPSVSTEKAPKGDQDTGSANGSTAENLEPVYATGSLLTKRAASEGHRSRNSNTTVTAEIPPFQGTTGSNTTEAATTPATQASEQSQVVVSTPSSPEFGITSASTLLKDDDLFSNANASSDSTWEKLSQGSQNGSKPNDKIDNEKEHTVIGSWDEESLTAPAPVTLKEAPPPAVNIWKQRIDAKAAKQPANTLTINSSSQTTTAHNLKGITKPFDIGAESRKYDSRKQAKRTHGGADEKPATAGAREGIRQADAKLKVAEASEVGTQRVPRVAKVDKSVSVSMAPPPLPGDAQSWPTPDSAVDEEKRKTQERVERGEKEKPATVRAHGKEKWMPVPYVPTYVPSTPLPNIRKGARAPRGGRDSAPRGGGLSTDKATAESPEVSVSSQPLASERSKGDLPTARTSSGSIRPKRASSAGPPAARDQRRGSDITAIDKRKDTGNPISQAQAEASRASATHQDEAARSKRFTTDPDEVECRSGAVKGFQEPISVPIQNEGASDSHAHPRSNGLERRGEVGPRTYDYARDFHYSAPTRERGEGRPERGRGGYRSRGNGNHPFTHTTIPNGHTTPYSYAPSSTPNKSSSFHDRHASQFQSSTYQPRQAQGRFRSGSQSFSVPHTTINSRFPQSQHTTLDHHLPNLQTDVANAWGFQPGSQGIMSANPYNPYMEQVSIVGMVSMQM